MNVKTCLLLSSLLGGLALFAAEPWEDPSVNAINRLPARAISIPCESPTLALDILRMKRPKDASRWVISLNGEWFFRFKSATAVDWEKAGKIQVPGCWQLQGEYDPPLYANVQYPIEKDAPRVTKAPADKTWTCEKYRNPVGLYSTTFKRPWSWWFRRTIIHFGGVSSAFRLRVNGQEVGYSEDSRLPAEFDLTPYLKVFGENTLEVEVYKHCDGTYLEDQDFWRLSGIFREVYLVSEHKDAPFDLVVETKLADDLKSGSYAIRDEKGKVLKSRKVFSVNLWNPESPHVYEETVAHRHGWWIFGGTDYRAVSFGFRKVEIKDAVLYLNGQRVLVKGVNRHELEPATGYTVTPEGMRHDISVMKHFNVNAVRTCHYPDVPEWYDLCDRAGLMVVCEANIESHGYDIYTGTNSLSFRKEYEQSHVERGTRMVETLRNHPSILIWSLGNEAGKGDNFRAEAKAVRGLDPTRPIHYECLQDDEVSDIKCPMYSHPWDVEKYVKDKPKKPYIHCEYTHAMGNSNGGVSEYWDLARKYASYQGGFVWDFMDQALWKTDARGKWLAYGGDFGDKPNDDNFNCNGLFDALRNPHPGAFELKHCYQNIHCDSFDFATGKVRIRNEFMFTALTNQYCCIWHAFDADGVPTSKGTIETFSGLAPGESAEFTLKDFKGDSVNITFFDGVSPCAWNTFAKPFVPRETKAKDEGEQRTNSSLASDLGLRLNFWRAPTDNDRGWKMPEVCKVWKDATESQKLPKGVKEKFFTQRLEDGALLVDWTLTVPTNLPPIPRVGLTFTVPKADRVEYFGLGPWENYDDRATGTLLAPFNLSVGLISGIADKETGTIAYPEDRLNPDNYSEPGEQGYRTGCRWLKVGDVTVKAVEAPFGFNVWPYPQSMLEGKKHQWELKAADELTVNIDAVQMGVGGDDSWGSRPHEPYMPGAGTYRLSFLVEGL